MKKILSITILLSTFILVSCWETSTDTIKTTPQAQEENKMINSWNDWNTFKSATISNDKSNEATEEVEVSTWQSATVTSFGSWESVENNSWKTN